MKNFLKIGLAILIAGSIVKLGSNEIFIANSPKVRSNLVQHIVASVQAIGPGVQFALARGANSLPEQKLKNIPLEQIASGVYAKSEEGSSYTVIKANEVEWIEYTFVVKGKVIKIRVPKGQAAPTQDLIEKKY